jgi:hypothetical protein
LPARSKTPEKVESVFDSALKLPPEERDAFLAGECGDDAALRDQVRQLLAAHEAAGNFLNPDRPLSPEVED